MSLEKKRVKPILGDYVVPIFTNLSLLISCAIVSPKKYFWNDELLSFYLLDDPSFKHMMMALSDKINASPPLYFVLGWLWTKVFTATELSLRMFSSLVICMACVIVWITLRRTFNFWSATIGTISIFCLSRILGLPNEILYQNAEARFYGLFLAVCSLGLLQFDLLCRKERCSWRSILANTCIHTAIIQTHIYGFLYSGAILFAFIIRDRFFKVFRPKVYLSIILSWLSFIPWIGLFINQSDLGKPRFWLTAPSTSLLIRYSIVPSLFLTVLIILSLIIVNKAKDTHFITIFNERFQRSRRETSLLIFAYSFLGVPAFAWIISHTLKPIFLDRYIIPTVISWSIIIAYFTSHIIIPFSILIKNDFGRFQLFKFLVNNQRLLLTTTIAILIMHPIYYAEKLNQEQFPGSNDEKYGYTDLPIVVEYSHPFLKRFHYSQKRNRYFFILDWQTALDEASGLFSAGEYKTMDALKRNYPALFQNNVVESQDFIKMYKRFLVLDIGEKCTSKDVFCSQWSERRIRSDSKYDIKKLGIIDNMNLLLVESQK
jgi:hypothetical protein